MSDILTKPKYRLNFDVASTDFDEISQYIRGHEGIKQEAYIDTSGHKTIGVGHKILEGEKTPETPEEIEDLFNKDLTLHIERTKGLFPGYETYPIGVKKALVDGVFRGEYKKGHKTVEYINTNQWGKVPGEYIDRKDYYKSKASEGTKKPFTGVYKRMDENAQLFENYNLLLEEEKKLEEEKQKELPDLSFLNPFQVKEARASETKKHRLNFGEPSPTEIAPELPEPPEEIEPEEIEPEIDPLTKEARDKTLEEFIESQNSQYIQSLEDMDKSGMEYSKKIEIDETGETITVTKDVSKILRENRKQKNNLTQFLDCISKL